MKKKRVNHNYLDRSALNHKITTIGKAQVADINILLNRVRFKKKKEFKVKMIFSISLLLITITLGIFLLSE